MPCRKNPFKTIRAEALASVRKETLSRDSLLVLGLAIGMTLLAPGFKVKM